MFHQPALKVDYILGKSGMALSGESYITCRSIPAAAAAGTELKSVSVGQVKGKDVPCSDG